MVIQEVLGPGQFTGIAPDGTPTEEALFRGRVQKRLLGTVGGELDSPDVVGMRVEQVFWDMVCASAPDVSIYIVDDDGIEYLIHTETGAASGSYMQTNGGFLVPPSFKVRVKASQAMDDTAVSGENTGVTGDGVTPTYALQLVNGNVVPGTVSIVAGSVTFTDPASDGVLVGAGGGGGSGTIDYATGAVSITLTTPADFNAVNALATYDWGSVGRVMFCLRQGWGQPTASQTGIIGRENLPPTMQRS